MNYYPFHLGDYAAHTAHLEPMEDLAYRRMLDLYYRTEKPLPHSIDAIARLIRLKGQEQAIENVINEFFEDCSDGWCHARCDEEIAHMQDKQAKARAAAQRSHSVRIASAEQAQSGRSATNTNTNTNTNTKEKKESASRVPPKPAEVDEQVWLDWLALRKNKRAPVTETVLRGAIAEAGKAGMALNDFLAVWCRRGSQGLEAGWLKESEIGHQRKSDVLMQGNIAAAQRYLERQS